MYHYLEHLQICTCSTQRIRVCYKVFICVTEVFVIKAQVFSVRHNQFYNIVSTRDSYFSQT